MISCSMLHSTSSHTAQYRIFDSLLCSLCNIIVPEVDYRCHCSIMKNLCAFLFSFEPLLVLALAQSSYNASGMSVPAYVPSTAPFSSTFQQPSPPTINAAFRANYIQHKWYKHFLRLSQTSYYDMTKLSQHSSPIS